MFSARTAFIVNPHAGGGSTGSVWHAVSTLAEKSLGRFSTSITRHPGDATTASLRAVRNGARRIVAVGGDGTLNEVVNAFMTFDPSIREDLTLGVIPNGTGCDFVKSASIPMNATAAIRLLREAPIRRIDVGKAVFSDQYHQRVTRYFLNIASFGLGGEVAQMASRMPWKRSPLISFMLATLISVLRYGKKRIRIKTGGRIDSDWLVWNVAVSNGCFHGGGMNIAPDARFNDGLLHVTVIGELSLAGIFLNFSKLYDGRIYQVDKVFSLTATHLEAASDEQVLIEIDGEQPGTLPIEIDVIPGAINLITPGGEAV